MATAIAATSRTATTGAHITARAMGNTRRNSCVAARLRAAKRNVSVVMISTTSVDPRLECGNENAYLYRMQKSTRSLTRLRKVFHVTQHDRPCERCTQLPRRVRRRKAKRLVRLSRATRTRRPRKGEFLLHSPPLKFGGASAWGVVNAHRSDQVCRRDVYRLVLHVLRAPQGLAVP